ncbi:hypothetical protein AN958_05060 [Leucoagaricus sp. SymC.cos]|nr:hypothetical protein AN958_05060 [Leucoagaricus sp. SymC.cos]
MDFHDIQTASPPWPVFPPFPPAPSDVTIVPFKDFKENGIRVTRDENGQEVDGCGIPTAILPLYAEPDSDFEWESQNKTSGSAPLGPQSGGRKQWWEYWSEYDDKRRPFAFNSEQPRLQRIRAALSSFRGSRRWPFERVEKPGPKYFYGQFRVFIGATGYPPAWNRTDKPKPKEEDSTISPDFSDNETGHKSSTNIHTTRNLNVNGRRDNEAPVRPPYAHYNIKPVDIDSDEAVRELLELDRLRREEQLIDFLLDPERAVKVFLSSYSRDQSFWWTNDNLDIMPRVLCFFLKFVLKNRVFPDANDERNFQKALRIAEAGHKELPLTPVIAKFLPDEFSKACRDYWGAQRKHTAWSDDEDDDEGRGNTNADGDNGVVISDAAGAISKITNIDIDEDEDGELEGDGPSAYNTSTPSLKSFSPLPILKPTPEAFKSLLASTNPFPTTHTLGTVERSLRRIKRVYPPGAFVSFHTKSFYPPTHGVLNDSLNATERDLETMLAKIVLVPWLGSGVHGFEAPEILRRLNHTDDQNVHDPLEDEITVLVSVASKHLDVLRDAVGMGIAGTWVQIVPIGEDGADSRMSKYWYLEEHSLVVPSFETS